jgi:uncharacterized protein YciI
VTTFYVVLRRSGPNWDASKSLEEQSDWIAHAEYMDTLTRNGSVFLGGPLGDERRVILICHANSEDDVRQYLTSDPWNETHLVIDSIDQWTIRLDGRLT